MMKASVVSRCSFRRGRFVSFCMVLIFVVFCMMQPPAVNLHEEKKARHSTTTSKTTTAWTWSLRNKKDEEEKPEIVWLASFPNSGTSYTMTMAGRATDLSTATNYAQECLDPTNHPVYPNASLSNNDNPPWWTSNRRAKPHFVLTKTHCVLPGLTNTREPETLLVPIETWAADACAHSYNRDIKGQPHHTQYGPDRVKKVIHLMRHPLDNLVSRYHHQQKEFQFQGTFREHCDHVQNHEHWDHWKQRLFGNRTGLLEKAPAPPPLCWKELFEYTHWHNQIFAMTKRHQWPTLFVRYEDYVDNSTQLKVLDWLEQTPIRGKPLHSFRYRSYILEHFEPHERESARVWLQQWATPDTWEHLRYYFTADKQPQAN